MSVGAHMRWLAGVVIVLAAGPADAAGLARPGQGSLFGGPAGEAPMALPLGQTTVRAHSSAGSARVVVSQVFVNPHRDAIEAVYVFPLPAAAAVSGATIKVAGRVIRGRIDSRQRAREAYAAAKSAGRRVVTVEQERPNIFTQSVSHIPGGGRVEVELEYQVPLSLTAGTYEFRFPLVVAPRSVVGAPDGSVPTGGGRLPDTHRVPDASRITPPVLPQGLRSGRDVDIELVIDEGSPLLSVDSPSHALRRKSLGGERERVSLAQRRQIPNRDLVIRYRPKEQRAMVAVQREVDGSGFIAVTVPIRALSATPATAPSSPVVFLVDDSSSMAGQPFASAVSVVREALWALPAGARFAVVPLSGARPFPLGPVSRQSVSRAHAFLSGLRPRKRSDALPALRAAAGMAGASGVIAFVTDGWFSNEREVAAWVAKARGPRVFPVALGSAPNGYFAELLALAGGGVALYLALGDDPGRTGAELARVLAQAPIEPVTVKLSGSVHSMTPRPIAGLFGGRPARFYARFGPDAKRIGIEVAFGEGPRAQRATLEVDVRRAKAGAAVAQLWARQRIAELELDAVRTGADHSTTIGRLGIEFSLLTPYTSFLAIDEGAAGQAAATTVYVPVDVPQGTRRNAILRDSNIDDDSVAPAEPTVAKTRPEGKVRGKAPAARRPRVVVAKPKSDRARKPKAADKAEAPAPQTATEAGADVADGEARLEEEEAFDEGAAEQAPAAPDAERAQAVQPVASAAETLALDSASRRWWTSLSLGVSLVGGEDRAASATVSVGGAVFAAGRFGLGIDLSAALPVDSDIPAAISLAPRLSLALGADLELWLGAGPTLTSDGDVGALSTVLSRLRLTRQLSALLRFDHLWLGDQVDVDSISAGVGLSF